MEVSFLVYFKSGTVLYLLQENNSPELLLAGQVHTVAFLITLVNFYLFIKLAPIPPAHTWAHMHAALGSMVYLFVQLTSSGVASTGHESIHISCSANEGIDPLTLVLQMSDPNHRSAQPRVPLDI